MPLLGCVKPGGSCVLCTCCCALRGSPTYTTAYLSFSSPIPSLAFPVITFPLLSSAPFSSPDSRLFDNSRDLQLCLGDISQIGNRRFVQHRPHILWERLSRLEIRTNSYRQTHPRWITVCPLLRWRAIGPRLPGRAPRKVTSLLNRKGTLPSALAHTAPPSTTTRLPMECQRGVTRGCGRHARGVG